MNLIDGTLNSIDKLIRIDDMFAQIYLVIIKMNYAIGYSALCTKYIDQLKGKI